ncbi:hypothetical protein GCM10028786_24820 [Flaviaesturariibacter terrae]
MLDDLTIKPVTQQYISRPGGHALSDLYFPQLGIHVEVDEAHHKNSVELDSIREADIVNATGHKIYRIDASQPIESIHQQTDLIVSAIRQKKAETSNFRSWNIEEEFDPRTWIKKGSIEISDQCAFKTKVQAVNCFGHSYKAKGARPGGINHPFEKDKLIWFPKLYKNDEWDNSISPDESFIVERPLKRDPQEHIDKVFKSGILKRIVFAQVESTFGDVMYRFRGLYKLDKIQSSASNGLWWLREAESVRTYAPKK